MPDYLSTKSEFDKCIQSNPAVIVDFTASWCGPCKMIAPHFAQLESQFPTVVFKKVDVDENREAAAAAGVSAMPTFAMYKGGRKVDSFSGASVEKLRDMLIRHAPPARPAMPPREPHQSAGIFAKIDAASAIQQVQQTDGVLLALVCGTDEASKTLKTTLDAARFAAIATQYKIVFLLLQEGTPDFENFKQMYPILVVPTVYFIGPTGLVLHFFAGVKSESEIREALRTALANKKGTTPAVAGTPEPVEGDAANASTSSKADDTAPALAEASPSSPSSTSPPPETNDETPAAKSARERARELQQQLRMKQEEAEREKERQDEIKRRMDGKLAQECRQRVEEQKRALVMEQAAKKRRDEEEQDRIYREKLRKQLEEDRRARQRAKDAAGNEAPSSPQGATSVNETPSLSAVPASSKASGAAKIKINLLSGEAVTNTFQASDPLQVVFDFIESHQPGIPCILVQAFPRRQFTTEDGSRTLAELDLVPNVALTCSPVAPSRPSNDSPGTSGGWFSWLTSMFSGDSSCPPAQPAPPSSAPPPAAGQNAAHPQQWGARVATLSDSSNADAPKSTESFYNGNTTEYKG